MRAASEAAALREALQRTEHECARASNAEETLRRQLEESARRAEEARQQLAATEETSLEEASGRKVLVDSYLELQAEITALSKLLDACDPTPATVVVVGPGGGDGEEEAGGLRAVLGRVPGFDRGFSDPAAVATKGLVTF